MGKFDMSTVIFGQNDKLKIDEYSLFTLADEYKFAKVAAAIHNFRLRETKGEYMAFNMRLIEIEELKSVRWTCPFDTCGATYEIPVPSPNGQYPQSCFYCKTPVPGSREALLEAFIENIARAKSADLKISFLVNEKVQLHVNKP